MSSLKRAPHNATGIAMEGVATMFLSRGASVDQYIIIAADAEALERVLGHLEFTSLSRDLYKDVVIFGKGSVEAGDA